MNHCWQLNGRGSAVDPTDSGLELLVSLANEVESEQPRHVIVDTSLFEKTKTTLNLASARSQAYQLCEGVNSGQNRMFKLCNK